MSDWHEIGIRVIGLTRKLVVTPSVVDSDGEAEITDLLAGYLSEQSEGLANVNITVVDVPKPRSKCKALMAYWRSPADTPRTIIIMGHTDTVGLEPYGSLAAFAYDTTELKKRFRDHSDPQVAAAAASEDWAFGRGWHDMKGGVATSVEVFLHEARRGELAANLLLVLTPDEESASRGLRALIPGMAQLKEREGLEFIQAVNTDYTAPLAEQDDSRYFYSGVVGKFLVGLSVFGRPTHVGETFGGVNASTLAGFLAYGMEHGRKLMAGVGGEWLPPPTVLHIADRRERYDVMTIDCADVYINVFHLAPDPAEWWPLLLNEVRRQVNNYDAEMRKRYNRFVAKADQELPRYGVKPEVIDYAGLTERVRECVDDFDDLLAKIRSEASDKYADDRRRALHVIGRLHGYLPPGRPVVVVSLLPPFYPAQVNSRQDPEMAQLIDMTAAEGLKHRRVYPYIADMSYFCFDDNARLADWQQQSPLWFTEEEIENYRSVATRVCNLGPFGAGAHTELERVHIPFLRDRLPRLLSEALHTLADGA